MAVKKMRIHQNKNAGFSLLEVILSMAILAIISIPLLKYFSDSAKYNARMETKQKATMLAQDITENLKSEEKPLIRIKDGGTVYTVPYLLAKGYTVKEDLLIQTGSDEGTGSISFAKETGNYDVEILVKTDVPANSIVRPVIYGMDDTTDVLATEHGQTEEAIAYFTAINAAYATEHGTAKLAKDEIKKRMTRTFHIEVGMDGSYYTVQVLAEYQCKGLQGAASNDSYTASPLLDVRNTDLKNIYLLYDKISKKDESGLVKRDAVELSWDASVPLSCEPSLFFICQGQNASNLSDTGPDSGYRLQMTGMRLGQTIHTNISNADVTNPTGDIIDGAGASIVTKALTDQGTPVRLVEIQTKIYPKGHTASDEPYATVETTKGE